MVRHRVATKLKTKMTFDGRQPLTEDSLWQKTTFNGRWPLTEDDLWRKTTLDRRWPLTEDDLWRNTTLDRRQLLTKDDLWRKTTLSGNWPLMENDLQWKTTFNRVYSILKETNSYSSLPSQPQHNWPQTEILSAVLTGNRISCEGRNVRGIMYVHVCKKTTFLGKVD